MVMQAFELKRKHNSIFQMCHVAAAYVDKYIRAMELEPSTKCLFYGTSYSTSEGRLPKSHSSFQAR